VIALDPRVRILDGGRTLLGGDPPRALRLSDAGARVVARLAAGETVEGEAARGLAGRLLDAGLAHPRTRPAATPADLQDAVTAVIPVRDRPAALARCLTALAAADPPGRIVVVDDGSLDPGAVARIASAHGATVVRRDRPGGPAAARNAGLAEVETELVAFLDSDCIPAPGWLSRLAAALEADPRLGAVGARVRPLGPAEGAGGTGALARFAAVRSPLDLGPHPAPVRPGGRVAYLPTAALLVRRAALAALRFDEALRHGEDVDLEWRLLDAGWGVRYEPAAVVGHAEPARLGAWLARRRAYGSSAGALARRHPGRLAPVVVHPRPALAVGLAAARRPGLAAIAVAGQAAWSAHRLRRLRVPPAVAAGESLRGVVDSAAALGQAATMLAAPALLAGLGTRGTRGAALGLLLVAPAREYARARPRLDPLRWTLLSIADDVAYGAGVWAGAARARTLEPLRPRVVVRAAD
jgi:mycofactocin glycosyltransferase